MTLEECTKAELISVIKQLEGHTGRYYVELALHNVEERRDERRQKEEEHLLAVMFSVSNEIDQLYSPYKDDLYCAIPDWVVAKAKALAQKYDAAQVKWRKLMGLAPGK